MSYWTSMHDRVEAYLSTRRSLGYELRVEGGELEIECDALATNFEVAKIDVGKLICGVACSEGGSALRIEGGNQTDDLGVVVVSRVHGAAVRFAGVRAVLLFVRRRGGPRDRAYQFSRLHPFSGNL